MTPVSVIVRATDPVSEAGLTAQLRTSNELRVLDLEPAEDNGLTSPDGSPVVAVVGADRIDADALRLLRHVHRSGTRRVLMVLAHVDDTALSQVVEAGATSLIRRSEATPAQLISAIRATKRGESFISPDLLGRLVDQVRHLQQHVLSPSGMHLSGFSDREVDVLRLLAEGYTTSEVAGELSYSERTIKSILHDITTRFQLKTRSHAVAYALRMGLI